MKMSKKHGLLMLACCVIGMGAAAVTVFFFKVPTNNVFVILGFLLCPLSHILMMTFMGGHDDHEHHPTSEIVSTVPSPKELGKG